MDAKTYKTGDMSNEHSLELQRELIRIGWAQHGLLLGQPATAEERKNLLELLRSLPNDTGFRTLLELGGISPDELPDQDDDAAT